MGSILNENDRSAIVNRLQSLSTSSSRRWGSMDVAAMLRHLRLAAEMAVGELELPSANKRALQVFPLKHLLLYVLPFPKGAPTAPKLKLDLAGASFEEERTALLDLLERIAAGPRDGAGPAHPLFGPLTRREWGVATYKHTDHHLRQFGA
ncbi:MAG TPA: DUF1569 domain-containing protein [Pyrinomonadaceae bacterium]|nr:DUF1569 domain-containing protein [Pyrinomonadaceae bacterium]